MRQLFSSIVEDGTLELIVDETTGHATFRNGSESTRALDGYSVFSTNSLLWLLLAAAAPLGAARRSGSLRNS